MSSINKATPEEWDRAADSYWKRVASQDQQPDPIENGHPAVWPLVMVDMATRDKVGRERYGVPLQPFNGRDTLRDAYEEALDLAVYLRSIIYERDRK